MNNWKVIPTIVCATVLIFGAGVFTGGILVNYVKKPHPRPVVRRAPAAGQTNSMAANARGRPIRPPEILSKDFLQRLDGDLHLNREQHEAIQKIISENQNQIRKVIHDARLEIREVLTAEQRKQFDELVKWPFRKPIFSTNAPGVLPPHKIGAAKAP